MSQVLLLYNFILNTMNVTIPHFFHRLVLCLPSALFWWNLCQQVIVHSFVASLLQVKFFIICFPIGTCYILFVSSLHTVWGKFHLNYFLVIFYFIQVFTCIFYDLMILWRYDHWSDPTVRTGNLRGREIQTQCLFSESYSCL